MFTTEPLAARSRSAAARTTRWGARTFTAITASHAAASTSVRARASKDDAEFTTRSKRPWVSRAASTSASQVSGSARSPGTRTHPRPADRTCSASSSAGPSDAWYPTTRSKPAAASPWLIVAPTRTAPPVTSATRCEPGSFMARLREGYEAVEAPAARSDRLRGPDGPSHAFQREYHAEPDRESRDRHGQHQGNRSRRRRARGRGGRIGGRQLAHPGRRRGDRRAARGARHRHRLRRIGPRRLPEPGGADRSPARATRHPGQQRRPRNLQADLRAHRRGVPAPDRREPRGRLLLLKGRVEAA